MSAEPPRLLRHKGVSREWTDGQDKAFANIMKAVPTTPVLKYFDPAAQTGGERNASEKGMGFVLMQEDQPG